VQDRRDYYIVKLNRAIIHNLRFLCVNSALGCRASLIS